MGSRDAKSRCFPAIVTLLIFTLRMTHFTLDFNSSAVMCCFGYDFDVEKQKKKDKNENVVQKQLLIHKGLTFQTWI